MAIPYRLKCPKCGEVQDSKVAQLCRKCGTLIEIPTDGCIQIYRMGNPIGIAAAMGIYLNNQPYGHIANKQSIRIPMNAGVYKLHVTLGMTRKCNDPIIEIKPESNELQCYKAYIRTGFFSGGLVIEKTDISEMPQD